MPNTNVAVVPAHIAQADFAYDKFANVSQPDTIVCL